MPGLASVSARLDVLPYFAFHRRLLLMGGLGYTFDAMDSAIVAFILPVLRPAWHLTSEQIGLLGGAAAMGGSLGAVLAGIIGDAIGRRSVMMWALGLYSVASLGGAVSRTWAAFLAWRIVGGIGIYAESAIIAPYLAEFSGPSFRGRYIGALTGFFSFGFALAAGVGYLIVPLSPEAWRYTLIATAAPIVMILWWRRSLPESPRWLESRGRLTEAAEIVSSIESEFQKHNQGQINPYDSQESSPGPKNAPVVRVNGGWVGFRGRMRSTQLRRLFLMALILWFSQGFAYYAFFTWIPSLLVQRGMTLSASYGYSLAIFVAQIPGYFCAAALNDRIGRRAVIVTFMLSAGVAALASAFAKSNVPLLLACMALSFFMNGTYGGLYAYTAELFPTDIRATAQGVASSLSRIGAVISPIAIGFVADPYGFAGVFGMTCGALAVGVTAVILAGVSTQHRSLEDISAGYAER